MEKLHNRRTCMLLGKYYGKRARDGEGGYLLFPICGSYYKYASYRTCYYNYIMHQYFEHGVLASAWALWELFVAVGYFIVLEK